MNQKENYWRAVTRTYPSYVPTGEEVIMLTPPVVERPESAGKDCFGVLWEYRKDTGDGTYPAERDFVIQDISTWREDFTPPDLDSLDWDSLKKQADKIDRDRYLVSGFCEMGLFERTYLLMGMENALCAYLTDTDEMASLCDAIADYKIAVIQRFCETVKLDMMWYGDDWGTQSNLFIPPDIWRKTIKPGTLRIYQALKDYGVFINQHSCGYIMPIFQDLCDMGADMWNPCQPCNDLKLLKQQFGHRISFCGGIDSQFVLDNPATDAKDVVQEVRRCMDALSADYGGYVAAPSHTVPYDPIKLQAMKQAIKTYGKL